MAGGDAAPAAAIPPAVDYSAAMITASDNNKTVAMGQIMAQQFAIQQASADRQMQTAANLELGIENLDTKLQIAKLNYIQSMTEEEDRHTEKMTTIGGNIDAARAEQVAANTVDTTDFLNDGGGGYTPGAKGGPWDNASSYANGNRIDINEQMNANRQADQQQSARDALLGQEHESQRTQQLKDFDATEKAKAEAAD